MRKGKRTVDEKNFHAITILWQESSKEQTKTYFEIMLLTLISLLFSLEKCQTVS